MRSAKSRYPCSLGCTSSSSNELSSSEEPRRLNQTQLSRRWSLSPRTLEAWRWRGEGPAYLKIKGRIVYRLEDVEAFERGCLIQTNGPHTVARQKESIR